MPRLANHLAPPSRPASRGGRARTGAGRLLSLLLLLLLPRVAPAQDTPAAPPLPLIREIVYEGNRITQPQTMDRELVIAPGDAADPKALERSRQGIQDLGLFREVTVRQEPLGESAQQGVRVVFTVREKWYVIPLPRLEVNSEGDTGYGLQLRWNNLWGLNHKLEFLGVRRDFQRRDRRASTNLSTNYNIPFLGQTRNSLNVAADYAVQDSTSLEGIQYREHKNRLAFVLSRALDDDGPFSQGWRAGAGLAWQDQRASGAEMAPETFGMATGPLASLSYSDVHDYIYSETGRSFGVSVSGAAQGLASDYGYFSHFTRYSVERPVGGVEHQTLKWVAEVGGYHGGPKSREPGAFEFGGSERLRGYDRELIDGDVAYYSSLDFVSPVRWNWCRVLGQVEAGSALDSLDHPGRKLFYASAAVGARLRITWLVNVNFEAGLAYPLVDGDGLRIFARAI